MTDLLSAFKIYLSENPLPIRRRLQENHPGLFPGCLDLPALVAGDFRRRADHRGAASRSFPSEPQDAPGFPGISPDHLEVLGQHGATLCCLLAGLLPVPGRKRDHPARSGARAAAAGHKDPGTEGAGRCPAHPLRDRLSDSMAQRDEAQAHLGNPGWPASYPGQGDRVPDAVCRAARRRGRAAEGRGCRAASKIGGVTHPPR